MVSEVTEPTILMSTRADGLFEVNDQTRRHKIIGQSVRALAPDGFEGALVMVGGRELGQRAPNGHWMTNGRVVRRVGPWNESPTFEYIADPVPAKSEK